MRYTTETHLRMLIRRRYCNRKKMPWIFKQHSHYYTSWCILSHKKLIGFLHIFAQCEHTHLMASVMVQKHENCKVTSVG